MVDDREANLVAMEALLGDGDWQVHTVNSGEAALKALLELDVELVLLDVQMPGMDGFEVARLMRGSPHTRYTPIIFVSAIAHTRDSVLRGYATGAVDFISRRSTRRCSSTRSTRCWPTSTIAATCSCSPSNSTAPARSMPRC